MLFRSLDDAAIAHRIAMLQLAGEDVADDLHVAVRMRAEAHAGQDEVVVDDTQAAEAEPLRVVIVREAEGEIAVQPTVVDVAAFIGASNRFHADTMRVVRELGKYHVACLSIALRHT